MKKYVLLLAALFLTLPLAYSEDIATTKTDWYMGFGVGIGDTDNNDSVARRIFGGKTAFANTKVGRFGVELGATEQDTVTDTLDLTLVYRYGFTPQTDLLLRAGVAYWDQLGSFKEDGTSFTYAVGLEQNYTAWFMRPFVRAEWQRVDEVGDNDESADAWILNGGFRF